MLAFLDLDFWMFQILREFFALYSSGHETIDDKITIKQIDENF